MTSKRRTQFLAELRESFSMAMQAIAAHKLRSALTLLGVLIGVFSIIVVMTALRVMQSDIESKLSQLGINCFMIQKRPGLMFNSADWERIARRKNITYANGQNLQERLTMAANIGMETTFWGGQIETRFASTAPSVMLFGETPGSFPARNWLLDEGRILSDADVDGARDVAVLGASVAMPTFQPRARHSESLSFASARVGTV